MKQQPILAVVTDAHNCHAMTEELIDTWFLSLTPEQKAAAYTASLEEQPTPGEKCLNLTIHGSTVEDIIARGERTLTVMKQIAGTPLTTDN